MRVLLQEVVQNLSTSGTNAGMKCLINYCSQKFVIFQIYLIKIWLTTFFATSQEPGYIKGHKQSCKDREIVYTEDPLAMSGDEALAELGFNVLDDSVADQNYVGSDEEDSDLDSEEEDEAEVVVEDYDVLSELGYDVLDDSVGDQNYVGSDEEDSDLDSKEEEEAEVVEVVEEAEVDEETVGLGIRSFQKNATFLHSLTFFCILYKKNAAFFYVRFTFFIK